MTSIQNLQSLIILGSGYSAYLSAIALDTHLEIKALIGPEVGVSPPDGPKAINGQHGHSHIFLPRLESELNRLDPLLLDAFAERGLHFVPGSKRLGPTAPAAARRLFATRWQFDKTVQDIYRDRAAAPEKRAHIEAVRSERGAIHEIVLRGGDKIAVDKHTLVLDAMGSRSPIMAHLISGSDDVQLHDSNIVYITQFFRLNDTSYETEHLPDPLVACSHDFGAVKLMLYPAQEGWFSVTLAISSGQKDLIKKMRRGEHFLSLCQSHPGVRTWLNAATPVGPNKIYVNPKNRWNGVIFDGHRAPSNYLAVGDALVTTIPTLGANCSFAATHVRVVRDLVQAGTGDLHQLFSKALHDEHFSFFEKALCAQQKTDVFIPYDQSRQARLSKRIKGRLRRALGLDRARILRDLARSSSLPLDRAQNSEN